MSGSDFDALVAQLQDLPGVSLRERADAAWAHVKASFEAELRDAADDLLQRVLGVQLSEAESVQAKVTGLDGAGKIDLEIDGIMLRVVFDGPDDENPSLLVGVRESAIATTTTYTPISSLLQLGQKLDGKF